MFGINQYMINTNLPGMPNAWKMWVDHIMKKKELFGFKKAALIHDNGVLASASKGFNVPAKDVQALNHHFAGSTDEKLSFRGKTYIIKHINSSLLVAFNGSKYLLVTKSKSMYIISMCESRAKSDEAAKWLNKLGQRLIEKDY